MFLVSGGEESIATIMTIITTIMTITTIMSIIIIIIIIALPVGAYSPADADVSSTVPVKYGYCDDSTTNSTGR